MEKKNFAIITLDCCEGCKNIIFNSERFLDILDLANLRFFEEQTPIEDYGKTDFFIIIGLPNKSFQKKMLEAIPKDKEIILVGTCTNLSGIYGLNRKNRITDLLHQRPNQKVIGCPVQFEEIHQAIKNVNTGSRFLETKKTVCYECTLNNNPCFLEKEQICAGALTTGGCNSICVNNNAFCIGCRGITDTTKENRVLSVVKSEKSKKDLKDILRFFNNKEE